MTASTPPKPRWASAALLLLLLVGSMGTVGCRCSDEPGPQPVVSATGNVERGDQVLVEPAAGEFFQGRVLARLMSGGMQRLKVQRADGELVLADAADVYRLEPADAGGAGGFAVDRRPPGAAPRLSAGTVAICRRQRGTAEWVGCRVVAAIPGAVQVVDYAGARFTAELVDIALPSELTRMNLEQRFRAADDALRFEREARAAGDPKPIRGWAPGIRERVIAKRGDEWFSAYVIRFYDDGSYRVEWVTDRRESDVEKRFVISEPPYSEQPLRGHFALQKPSALSRPWQRVKVISVRPEVVVENALGEQHAASLRELVPLGAKPEPEPSR